MAQRLRLLERWLGQSCRLNYRRLSPASADASFRRYFRVELADGDTRIAMDAPPDKEDSRPFLRVADLMRSAGLHVPQILAHDLGQGFMLLEDLGSTSYLDALRPDSVDTLYDDAMRALLRLQTRARIGGLPLYDRAMLLREMGLFRDWLLGTHLGLAPSAAENTMLASTFDLLVDNALAQPVVCVHRDYHSRNLMRLEHDNPGVIDFQDAVAGPISYDLVSLLRDCYIRWPADRVDDWVASYHAIATDAGLLQGVTFSQFLEWFDLMGVQRHLKAAGIFARLNHRDGKPGYLADIPRTLNYIVEVGRRRRAVRELAGFIGQRMLPRL